MIRVRETLSGRPTPKPGIGAGNAIPAWSLVPRTRAFPDSMGHFRSAQAEPESCKHLTELSGRHPYRRAGSRPQGDADAAEDQRRGDQRLGSQPLALEPVSYTHLRAHETP